MNTFFTPFIYYHRIASPIPTLDISNVATGTPSDKKTSEKSKGSGKEKAGERSKEEFTPSGKDKDKLKSRLTQGKLSLKRYRYTTFRHG